MLSDMVDHRREEVPDLAGSGPGDGIDRSLIEYCLSLTPAERLRQAEEFAEFILTARRLNGVPWRDTGSSSRP
jgi:hypothetical protein